MRGPVMKVCAAELREGDFVDRYGVVTTIVTTRNPNLVVITFDTRESGNRALAQPTTTVLRERHETFVVRLED